MCSSLEEDHVSGAGFFFITGSQRAGLAGDAVHFCGSNWLGLLSTGECEREIWICVSSNQIRGVFLDAFVIERCGFWEWSGVDCCWLVGRCADGRGFRGASGARNLLCCEKKTIGKH